MKNKLTLIITQEDIDRGTPRDSEKCPVGLALRRHSIVSFASISFFMFEGLYYKNPEELSKFVLNYDREELVHPLRITIDLDKNRRNEADYA